MSNRYERSASMESLNNTYWLNIANEKQVGGQQIAKLLLTRALIATVVLASAITVSTGML